MTPGLSIQIVWPLAAHEANMAESEHIEPPHLLLGILKFAELEEKHIEQLVRDPKIISPLLSERDDIRSELRKYSIDVPYKSREIRYGIRKRLGKSGHPYDGKSVIHRSPVSREICKMAEDAALAIGSPKWCAVHLLDVLLKAPSRVINEVLLDAGLSGFWAGLDTPNLNRYGLDLTVSAIESQSHCQQNIKLEAAKDPVCKVLMAEILENKINNVLLIQKGKRSPKEIVESIVQYIMCDSAPYAVKGKRFIEIDITKSAWKAEGIDSKELDDRLRKLIQEARESGNVILFLNKFHEYINMETDPNYIDLVIELLSNKAVRCIGGLDEENYEKHVKKDPVWKKLIRPIWIHDLEEHI